MQDALTFWDRIAPKYAKSPVRDPDAYDRTLERVRAYLSPEDRVLELGAGTGTTALKLAPLVQDYLATDLAPAMVGIGEKKADARGVANLRFLAADIHDPALDGQSYHVVAGFNLFHLVEDPDAAFARAAELTKPGGLFISKTVCRPGTGTPWKLRLMLLALPIMQALGKAPYVNFMEIDELEQKVTAAGFKILEVGNYPVEPPNHFIVARKD